MDQAIIAANLDAVRGRIATAAERSGRDPRSVQLVAVSKTFPVESVLAACAAGQRSFGENRVQEALPKIAAVAGLQPDIRWHLIGRLQSNKVQKAVQNFAMIQSVDSLSLAEAIARRASAPTAVLVEVNVAAEASKGGFAPDSLGRSVASLRQMERLDVRGLMTVAPLATDAEAVRPVFRRLAELARELQLDELSMGMSGDFEVAIAEGATIVRIGSAIFGHRQP